MFLDIISDETFCTQSQIMMGKVPEFSAESLRITAGMSSLDIPAVILQLVSHDPEGSCDTNGH